MGVVFDPDKLCNCPTCGNKPEVVAHNSRIVIYCCGLQSFTEASKIHNMYKDWNYTTLGYIKSELDEGNTPTIVEYKTNVESWEEYLEPKHNKTMEKIKKEVVTETKYSYKGVDYVYLYKVNGITLLCDLHMTQAVVINESDDILFTIEIYDNQLIINK